MPARWGSRFMSGLKQSPMRASIEALAARAFDAVRSREQVVEVEGRSLRLTGSAEEQYRQWRDMLRDYQTEEAAPAHGEP